MNFQLNTTFLILFLFGGIYSSPLKVDSDFSPELSNREVMALVLEKIEHGSPAEVVKSAITGSQADVGLVNALVSMISEVKPEHANFVRLTAAVYAPDAFVGFGGDPVTEQAAVKTNERVLYDVYGKIIGRVRELDDGRFAVYTAEGKHLGYLVKRAAQISGVLDDTLQRDRKFLLELLPGITLEYVFGKSPVKFNEDGLVEMRFSANLNFIAVTDFDFTFETTLFAGAVVLQPGPSASAIAKAAAANDSGNAEGPSFPDALTMGDLKLNEILNAVGQLDLPEGTDVQELIELLATTPTEEIGETVSVINEAILQPLNAFLASLPDDDAEGAVNTAAFAALLEQVLSSSDAELLINDFIESIEEEIDEGGLDGGYTSTL